MLPIATLLAALLGSADASAHGIQQASSRERITANASKYAVLHTFKGGPDGADPTGAVIADAAGSLYGTTKAGGGSTTCTGGCGVVYKLTANHGRYSEQVLYAFKGGSDGANPEGALYADASGDLFGTTEAGGSANCSGGCGTVFELLPNSGQTAYSKVTLHAFLGVPDGAFPQGTLVLGKDGALYGTTADGGADNMCQSPSPVCGTLFKIDAPAKHYKERVIYAFQPPPDASDPGPDLFLGKDGALYGSGQGGASCGAPAYTCGSVFEVTPAGRGATEDFAFTLNPSDQVPVGGVVLNKAGVIFGTSGYQNGSVFALTPSSKGYTESVVHAFTGAPDGAVPKAGMIIDGGGALYGTTSMGGSPDCMCGAIYKLIPTRSSFKETILYSFLRGSGGMNPQSPLLRDTGGNLYGTAADGGLVTTTCTSGCGTVFRLSD